MRTYLPTCNVWGSQEGRIEAAGLADAVQLACFHPRAVYDLYDQNASADLAQCARARRAAAVGGAARARAPRTQHVGAAAARRP